jgi:hypothetical protein
VLLNRFMKKLVVYLPAADNYLIPQIR